MRSLKEIWDYARGKEKIPTPDELAVTFAAALMASGQYDPTNYNAAVEAAWWAVPEFYRGRRLWQTQIFPMMFAPMSSDPGEDASPAYVAQGSELPGYPSGAH